MNIDSIKNGIVIDHITAGKAMDLYFLLGLDKLDKVKEELADVLCYSILLADRYGLDLDEIIRNKMQKNAEKYPVEKASGVSTKYTDL